MVRLISSKKQEPDFLLQFRLKAYAQWQAMEQPNWAALRYPAIDYQDIVYYSAPRQKEQKASLEDVDPALLETFDKLGIPLSEQKRLSNVAVDAVFDSVSIATTYKQNWQSTASCSAPWAKPSKITRNWWNAIWVPLFPLVTTSSQRSIPRCSATAPLCTFPKGCSAPWSSPPTSASIATMQGSLSGP